MSSPPLQRPTQVVELEINESISEYRVLSVLLSLFISPPMMLLASKLHVTMTGILKHVLNNCIINLALSSKHVIKSGLTGKRRLSSICVVWGVDAIV